MKLLPTRYLRESDLEPYAQITERTQSLISKETQAKIQTFIEELCTSNYVNISLLELQNNLDLSMFVAILKYIGIIQVKPDGDLFKISTAGQLADDAARVIFLFLKNGFPVFDDWTRRFRTHPDSLCSLEFLHHMELQRIEHSRRAGLKPEVIHEIPVAYAIIKGFSVSRNKDVFLLELNKDWNRFNMIGGKAAIEDGGNYRITCLREIEEELSIPRSQVQLTQLTNEPLEGYSLSGHRGVLAHYPCMIYFAKFTEPLTIRAKDRWFTAEEIVELRNSDDPGLMINPIYLDFIFYNNGVLLKDLDYSVEEPIDEETRFGKFKIAVSSNKEWIVALLSIIGTIAIILRILLS